MKMSSPKSKLLRKINPISPKTFSFKIAILGQNGVGKTALAVRFCTRRYIGDYDSALERIYTCTRTINDSHVEFEIWDTAGLKENSRLKEQIRWADAVILVYDVTDTCSFSECSRLRFLISSFSKKKRWKTLSDPNSDIPGGVPVALVGNKTDQEKDRMVLPEEGAARCSQLKCVQFHELSVREDVDDVISVFDELFFVYKKMRRFRLTLSFSRISLVDEKPRSISDDENEHAESAKRGFLALPSSPLEEKPQVSLRQRSRLRRRESMLTMS